MENQQIQTSPEELFVLIGEREFIKYKQQQELVKLYVQIDEMSKEITKLKEELKEVKGVEILDMKRG